MSETNTDPQQEYAEALAVYRDAQARLQEAKRHIPEFPRDRDRRLKREEREKRRADRDAEAERYLESLTPEQQAAATQTLNDITAQALAILHQRINPVFASPAAKIGTTFRIRMPVTYRIIENDHE